MSNLLEPGQPAPDFRAVTTSGETVSLADFRGRWLVLYFYPKAFTPGCTKESRRFRDNYPELKALGAEVVGVSIDEHEVQCEFAREHQLGFPLIGDSGKTISRAYGALRTLLPFDKRITYIIDPDGRIAARFHHEVQVNRHLDDVVSFLREKKVDAGA